LRDAIDRLFAGSVISPSLLTGGIEGFPPTCMRITDDDVIVEMAVPGANPNDINISVTGDALTISGEIRHHHGGSQAAGGQSQTQQSQSAQTQRAPGASSQGQTGQGQTFFDELFFGRFQRSFALPIQVEPDKTTAHFENGMLMITLPKSEATKPRKIQVKPQQTINGQSQSSQSKQGSIEAETVPVQGGSSS